MKRLLIILLTLYSAIGMAQGPGVGRPSNYTYINQRFDWLSGKFRGLHVPAGTTPGLTDGQFTGAGAVFVDSVNHRFYYLSGGQWRYGSAIDSVTYDTDSSYIWQGGNSFGISKGGFFSPNQTSAANTTHNAAGFNLTINNVGEIVLQSSIHTITADSIDIYPGNGLYIRDLQEVTVGEGGGEAAAHIIAQTADEKTVRIPAGFALFGRGDNTADENLDFNLNGNFIRIHDGNADFRFSRKQTLTHLFSTSEDFSLRLDAGAFDGGDPGFLTGGGSGFQVEAVDSAGNTVRLGISTQEYNQGVRGFIESDGNIDLSAATDITATANNIFLSANINITGPATVSDTTTYKPIVIDGSGNVRFFDRWPGGSGGGGGSDTANLVVEWDGDGERSSYVEDSTKLHFKNFHDTTYISWHTRPDSSIYALLDTAALRTAIGGSGGGPATVTDSIQVVDDDTEMTGNIAFNNTLKRLTIFDGEYYYHFAITDSVDATPSIDYDDDAQAYMDDVEAAGRTLTDLEKGYIDDLFVGLKADGVYSLIIDAIIPIWGTSTPSLVALKGTHAFAAVATPTFSSSGVDFNGTSQYITTDIIPGTHMPANDGAVFSYIQDNVTESSVDIGCATSSNRLELLSKSSTTTLGRMWNSGNGQVSATATTSQGMIGFSRTSIGDLRAYRNGSQLGSTNTQTLTLGSRPTHAIYIGARNGDGTAAAFSTRKTSGAFIMQGLTPTQVTDFTNRLETFYDAMGIGIIP